MRRGPDRLNAAVLTVLALALVGVGAYGLARGYGAFGDARAAAPILTEDVRSFVSRNGDWFWPVAAVLSLLVALSGRGASLVAGSPLLWAVAYVALALQLRWVLRRAGSFRWWAWTLFPVPLLAFDLVFARSLALTVVRRSVPWRGRDVSLAGGRSGEEVA